MRWCWVVWLVVSGCFLPDDDSNHHIDAPPPLVVVQQVVVPPMAIAAKTPVTVPIHPTIAGDLFAVVVASSSDLGALDGIRVGDETVMLPWLQADTSGCGDVLTLFNQLRPDNTAASITVMLDSAATVEIGFFEISLAASFTGTDLDRESVGVASAPPLDVPAGGLVFSTLSVCSSSRALFPSSFVSLGFATPHVDVAYALPAQAQSMGAEWSFTGIGRWASNTFVVAP